MPYSKIIDYDNKKLREELILIYRKILDIFTDNYWLADDITKNYYQPYLEFVEIWERYLVESLPADVLRKLNHTEETILPFYEHVEQMLSNLQSEIKGKRFWCLYL